MTDYYKILGVEKNASKEEIKEAYEKQVEKIKKEVVNEKRLNEFLKLFHQAYEALNSLEENQLMDKNQTLIMQTQEVEREPGVNNKSENSISKGRSASTKKNDFTSKEVSKNKDKKNKSNDNKEGKARKRKTVEKSQKNNTKQIFDLVKLPFKILALPLIGILSVIILLCQVINVVSWIASKLLIVGAISVGAIHLYQVKLGQTINYNILILAASVLLLSFFLPYVLRFVLKVFKKLNNVLKDFVF
ncbi:DnaJ domain-containing protein [Clostridium sp. JNZ J1-5]